MTTLSEKRRAWGFLLSEAGGQRSRSNGTLVSGQNLQAGTILGWVNNVTGSKLTAYTTGAIGSGHVPANWVAGVLGDNIDASAGDVACAFIDNDAEVNVNELIFPTETTAGGEQVATELGLRSLGIKVR